MSEDRMTDWERIAADLQLEIAKLKDQYTVRLKGEQDANNCALDEIEKLREKNKFLQQMILENIKIADNHYKTLRELGDARSANDVLISELNESRKDLRRTMDANKDLTERYAQLLQNMMEMQNVAVIHGIAFRLITAPTVATPTIARISEVLGNPDVGDQMKEVLRIVYSEIADMGTHQHKETLKRREVKRRICAALKSPQEK